MNYYFSKSEDEAIKAAVEKFRSELKCLGFGVDYGYDGTEIFRIGSTDSMTYLCLLDSDMRKDINE